MRYVRLAVPVLFVLALGLDLLAWGGLMHTPAVGPAVLASAKREAPLALIYMQAGGALTAAAGVEDWSARIAAGQLGDGFEPVLGQPDAAMDVIAANTALPLRLSHVGAPLLLAAWAVLWWLRPRQVRTIRQR